MRHRHWATIALAVALSAGCPKSEQSAPEQQPGDEPAREAITAPGGDGARPARPGRPVHTYSIVARDTNTGEFGAAVQSHWFSVGKGVIWAEAGVGAVATQSFAEPAYGPRGLALMRTGVPAPDALRALVGVDSGEAVRQVAFVDAAGRVGTHTGKGCIDHAGHVQGEGYSVQANIMVNERVIPAMAAAFEAAKGDLAERLMVALEAGQAAGGDLRGKQSAAMVVVGAASTGRVWADRTVDLRVDDHGEPIAELRRLLGVHRAYQHMNDGDVAIERGKMDDALEHYRAASRLMPDNVEMKYWHAVTLATNGRVEPSLAMFREVFAADASWVELTRRLHKPGIVPDTPEGRALVERIVAQAP